MAILFMGDVHLGLTRAANTTHRSRQMLKDALYNQASAIVNTNPNMKKVCLGDLFDKFSNPEAIVKQGMVVAEGCDVIIGGNHDVIADADKMGSLELIDDFNMNVFKNKRTNIYMPVFNESEYGETIRDNTLITGVPHHTTQKLFESTLNRVIEASQDPGPYDAKVLLLHCNYESPYELTETTNNLTQVMAEKLLDVFNYIVMGHEHQPRDMLDDRLIILGNIHPTGFNDISDKRIMIMADGGIQFDKVWSMQRGFAVYDHDQIPEHTEAQFVRIRGNVDHSGLSEVVKKISKLWKNSAKLLAVKSDVIVGTLEETLVFNKATIQSLPEVVEKELKDDPAMLELWRTLRTA